MKKLLLTLFILLSTLSFADIFNNKDCINAFAGIETTKFPSGVVDLNYQYEAKPDLYLQVGNQIRFMSNRNDWSSTYVGIMLDFKNFDYSGAPVNSSTDHGQALGDLVRKTNDNFVPGKEHNLFLLMRVGLSNDLDSSNSKGYCAVGVQYGKDYFVRVMLESENHKLRNSIGFGIKLKQLKFY